MIIPIGDNVKRTSPPIVPILLIALNLLVFAYQTRLLTTSRDGVYAERQFIETWGLVPAELADGQLAGLMGHMFIHGGVLHLLGNMFTLWAFACSLEVGLGSVCLLAFYVVWGLVAGLSHAMMDWDSTIPGIGASGAIAGLLGAYTVAYGPFAKIRTLIFIAIRPIKVDVPATAFGMGWILLQFWQASNDPEGQTGVAWYAHIGGFMAGALTMLFMKNHTAGELVETAGGELAFRERDDAADDGPGDIPAALPEPVVEGVPEACPYCAAPMDESNRFADNLVRCGNAECERLIYLNEEGVVGR